MRENQSKLRLWKWIINMRLHARIGVAASVIGSFGIGVAQGSRYLPHYEFFTWGLGGVLVAAAVLLLLRQPEAEPEDDAHGACGTGSFAPNAISDATPEYATSVFTRRYWGWVFLCCGVVAVLATPPRREPMVVRAAPRVEAKKPEPPPPPVVTNRPIAVLPPAPVVFPKLRLQGIHLLPSHPAAIINGRTCIAGDVIAGVNVVEVNHDSVMLEMAGEKRLLVLAGETRH